MKTDPRFTDAEHMQDDDAPSPAILWLLVSWALIASSIAIALAIGAA